VKRARPKTRPIVRGGASEACENLYRFIRLRLGDRPSDRELARRLGMEWKSFAALKHGKRQVPRVPDLERIAQALEVDPVLVFQAARGVPADEVMVALARQSRLGALVERVTDAVFTLDLQGRIEDTNPRFRELCGRSELAQQGVLFLDLLAPRSVSAALSALAALSRDGEVRGTEVVMQTLDGTERILELDATAVRDAGGADQRSSQR
jgi:PAS domain S-box-containing protein